MNRVLSSIFGAILAVGSVAYVCYDAWAWKRAAEVVDSGFRQLAAAATNDRSGGIYLESDSYYWLSYAKQIGEGEAFRVRYTFADNPPYGRPVHWSQSISWLLVLFGKLRQALTHEAWPVALEQGSVWINPALLILLTCSIGWALFKRVGAIAASLFVANLVALGDVGWEFQPLRPDHQSLQAVFGMLMLGGLVFGGAGWIRANSIETHGSPACSFIPRSLEIPDLQTAKYWFVMSAAGAALGFWISGVVGMMLAGILFGAGIFLVLFAPDVPEESGVLIRPELWRLWGRIAAIGSLLFYLLEYFPNHLVLRLEVNGPIYSIMLLAIGEALCQFMRARYASRSQKGRPLLIGILCTVVVAAVPLAILVGPQTWHALRDPQMFRLHNFIEEFYSLPRFAGPRRNVIFFENFGILPFFLMLAIALAAFSKLRLQEWAVLWLSFAVTLGVLVLGYFQVRWLGLYAAMNVWLALVTSVCGWRLLSGRLPLRLQSIVAALVVGLLLVQPIWFATRRNHQVADIIQQRTLPKQLIDPVLNKRLALALRAQEGPGTRVMAELDLAPALHYFGDGAGVASFYWENIDGLHAATSFFADDAKGEVARRIASERGLTHVAVQEGNRLRNYFYFIATGEIDQEAAKNLFAARLIGSEFTLPDWLQSDVDLQRMGFQVFTYGNMPIEERWRIYRIAPR